ncbi:MAG: hypothetical protein ACJA08_000818 [Cyclobacteriaceae bacterium]|jgi:hypothetical protein
MEAKYWLSFLMDNRILTLSCLILISLETASQIKNAPEWVRRIPVSEDTFYGMGVIEIGKSDQYRAKARKMALKEIIEKIFISVSSNSELTMRYEGDETSYYLDETISVESTNYLSGHQKVDEWIDKRSNVYYVLFKLDHEVYKENRKVYFEILEDVIHAIRTEAEQLFTQGEVTRSVNKLIDALSRIDKEIQKLVEPEHLISLQKWRLSALFELETQISRIGFELNNDYDFYADKQQPLIISEFIVDKIAGTPLSGLSTSLRVIKGDVFNHSFDHYIADNAIGIYGLFPEHHAAVIQVVAELPLPDQIKAIIDPTLQHTFISKPIVLRFNPYNIIFSLSDLSKRNFRNESPIHYLRRITNDLGLTETDIEDAFYEIDIIYTEKVEKLKNGQFDVELEIRIVVTRMRDKRELYHFSLPKTRATSSEDESAVSRAFDKSFDQSDQFLVTFVTFLCSQHH